MRYNFSFLDLEELEAVTKCIRPCRTTLYKLVEDKIETFKQNHTSLHFALGSKNVLERREVLLYTFTSFIAEFGGALGLFLGFSFLLMWNFIEQSIKILIHKFKTCSTNK